MHIQTLRGFLLTSLCVMYTQVNVHVFLSYSAIHIICKYSIIGILPTQYEEIKAHFLLCIVAMVMVIYPLYCVGEIPC